jgi:hypothetical protein
MQVIQDTNAGGRLGQALGTGLQELAHHKLAGLTQRYEQQQERSQFAQGIAPILGQDTANFLSHLGPNERKSALQNIGALMQFNQPAGQQQGGLEAFSQQPGQNQQPNQQIGQEQTPERAKLIQDVFTSPQEKREQQKLELIQRQAQNKEKEFNLKETKQYVTALKDKEKAAKESDLRLKRMANLIDKGNLPNASLWSFLSKIEDLGPLATGGAGAALGSIIPGVGNAVGAVVGGIVGGLSSPLAGAAKSWIKTGSPDVEEFEKLTSDFVKNAKQYFGSRLTDADLKIFMQSLPSLMQTDNGKKKVIQNLSSLNELAEIEAKAARSIIAANHGIPPLDLEQQVQNKISHKIDKVAKKFIG